MFNGETIDERHVTGRWPGKDACVVGAQGRHRHSSVAVVLGTKVTAAFTLRGAGVVAEVGYTIR
jgi:hypothetical protein